MNQFSGKVSKLLFVMALMASSTASWARDADDDQLCPGTLKGYLCTSATSVIGVLGSPTISYQMGFSEGSKGSVLGLTLTALMPTNTGRDLSNLTTTEDENAQLQMMEVDSKEFLLHDAPASVTLVETMQMVRDMVQKQGVDSVIFSDDQIALAIYFQSNYLNRI